VVSKYHHGGAGREGRVEGDELRVQCGLSCRERFWRRLCWRDRRIRRRFRRQPCPSKNDQSLPPHTGDGHSQPMASAIPVSRPSKNSCAGIAWIGPSSTSRSLSHAMAVVHHAWMSIVPDGNSHCALATPAACPRHALKDAFLVGLELADSTPVFGF
jgi:hypothetical protein